MVKLLFSHFRVTNVKLINEKKSLNLWNLPELLEMILQEPSIIACLGVAQACSNAFKYQPFYLPLLIRYLELLQILKKRNSSLKCPSK